MINQNWKTCMGLAAAALAAYSLCFSVAMAQVPAPPATPDLPDVETPAPPTDADTKADAEAKVQTDANVPADAKANLQTDTDVDAPANRTKINAETDTDVQLDPNAPADSNVRNRTRAGTNTQLNPDDASRPPRLDADSRLQTDTQADLNNDRTDQGQVSAGTNQRGRLGIQFSGDDGLAISQLAPGSIAARAGLRVQDEIVAINGQQVTTRNDLGTFLNQAQGPTIIQFRRNGQLQEVNVNLMSTNDNGGRVQSFYRGPDGGQVYQNGGGYGGRTYYRSSRRARGHHCHRH